MHARTKKSVTKGLNMDIVGSQFDPQINTNVKNQDLLC